jgi:hypothetical protein
MVLPSSGVYQAGAMIRGELIAKQTQVFDKKADQMRPMMPAENA